MNNSFLQKRIATAPPLVFTLIVTLAAFSTYACMYAFRKPFTAASFAEEAEILGLSYKSFLVISQVFGYMLSKFIGIKVVSEMKGDNRAITILWLVAIAELALLGFALTPAPFNAGFLFLNGLPLGMIWGLVFSFVEGRKQTEIMGLGLCVSFIFSSGFVKDVGKTLMDSGVSEFWMPFFTGAVFAIPLLLSVWLLNQIPAPTSEDMALRTKRSPMSGKERWEFFQRFALGLTLLIIVYTALTSYRDFRDNFLADIWIDLRGIDNTVDFSSTETPASIVVLGLLMLLVLIKDNLKALMINHIAIGIGIALAGISTFGFQQGWVSDYWWILLTGIGTYLAYIPFNSILFDRMIAAFRYVSNVGFLIYLADSFGYMGSVSILIYKDFGAKELSWVEFFVQANYALTFIGVAGLVISMAYFYRKVNLLHKPNAVGTSATLPNK